MVTFSAVYPNKTTTERNKVKNLTSSQKETNKRSGFVGLNTTDELALAGISYNSYCCMHTRAVKSKIPADYLPMTTASTRQTRSRRDQDALSFLSNISLGTKTSSNTTTTNASTFELTHRRNDNTHSGKENKIDNAKDQLYRLICPASLISLKTFPHLFQGLKKNHLARSTIEEVIENKKCNYFLFDIL
ncbi:13544_t:CDS:2 [Ambispora leptoticha]|uniref:13544_t:CDS:1 n=1 Tax=Ambispora leptoticha TaxID=144679 RepID=A0A9N9BNQ5_9GLOM|nr:13544_t:CDS:2 [Ambispora leptoticha]